MNTQKILLLLLIIIFSSKQFVAQISIDGFIKDADRNPIKNVLVEIIDKTDSTNIYSANTDTDGFFTINSITNVKKQNKLPNNYLVLLNYPNPFNPSTIIHFEIPSPGNVEIKIYDILGREVRTLLNIYRDAGADQIVWDGRNNYNQPVSAGIYLCQLKTKNQYKAHKMVLLDGGSNVAFVRNERLNESKSGDMSKFNSSFHFTVKVSGDSIIETSYEDLICSNDTTLSLQVAKLYKQATIGAEGGTLEIDGFELDIPSGAFSTSQNLRLYKDSNHSFGDNACSPLFRIKGLPDNIFQPFQVSIKYNRVLNGESAIATGNKKYLLDIDTNIVVYDVISASESNGILVSEIPADSNNTIKKQFRKQSDDLTFTDFLALTDGTAESNSQFKYQYFSSNLTYGDYLKIKNFLEQLFVKYKNLGFDYSFREWPMGIKIINTEDHKASEEGSLTIYVKLIYHLKKSFLTLQIPKNFTLEPEIHNRVIENGFLIVLQRAYWRDLTPDWKIPPFFWLDVATWNWMVQSYTSWNNLYSRIFTNLVDWVFRGIENFDGDNGYLEIAHGRGMGLMIEFIMSAYGEENIGSIYNDIGDGKHHVKAIIDNTDSPQIWLKLFYNDLMVNTEFNELLGDYWSTNAANTISIANLNEEKTVTDNFFDLSGKWYKLDLSDNIAPRSKLKITSTTNGIAQISVFTIQGNNLTFIDDAENELEVLDVEKYSAEGKDLIVLITNPNGEGDFKSTREITTKFKLIGKFSFVEVKFGSINGMWHYEDVRDSTNEYSGGVASLFWPEYAANFGENSFSVAYDVTDQYSKREEFYMNATLNENWDMIVNCNVIRVVSRLYENGSWGGIDSCSFSASNIPLVSKLNDELRFDLKGANLSNMDFYTYAFSQYQGLNFDNSNKLIQWWPDDGSYLRIYLYTNL